MHTLIKLTIVPVIALALIAGFTPAARAEEPIPTELETSNAQEFIGNWAVTIEVMGREIDLFINVVDVGGYVGATLDSPNQAQPLAMSNISLNEDGNMELGGELQFGESFSLDINILLEKAGPDAVTGRVKDKGGIFDAPLKGERVTEEELSAAVEGRRPDPTEARAQYGSQRIRIQFADLEKGNSDWERFQNLEEGEVYTFTLSRATKMYTDLDLKFGDQIIETENVAEDYPGVYSLWLKKADGGKWTLIFNEQPDIWGTRYDPEHNVAEVPLEAAKYEGDPKDAFLMEIDTREGGGILRIIWDDRQWEAPFTITR